MASVKINSSHIVDGPFGNVPYIPDTDIYSFMFHREEISNYPPPKSPDRVAFIDGPSGQKITFREMKKRIENLSRGLVHGMGINYGDAVCFYLPNHVFSEMVPTLTF
jgi:4-coumarate--CoA ligase